MSVPCGVIEGFYGAPYPLEKRLKLASFAAAHGLKFYICAPKNELFLRKLWKEEMPGERLLELQRFSSRLHELGLRFAFGISPLGLTAGWERDGERFLARLRQLTRDLKADFVCLLFDDVKKESEDIGTRQNAIIKAAAKALEGLELWACPAYYSFDPVLDAFFGRRPERYFAELTADLPDEVRIFWTGPKVISEDITKDDLLKARSLLGDRLVLWDNHPVNDSKRLCPRLHLGPFKGRRGLEGLCRAHAANPMTEALLSEPALATLPLCYENLSDEARLKARDEAAAELFGDGWEILRPLMQVLSEQGQEALSDVKRREILALCELKNDAGAYAELRGFLEGAYAFDPQCLT